MAVAQQLNWRALTLATVSFAVSFAAWGLVGGLAPVFADLYGLTASQTALLVAVPVLLGSLARLPMGMLTDRFGGRAMFTVLLASPAVAAWLVPLTTSYATLLAAAFFIGLAGSSFSIGAAFVSRWTPPARQGTALGVFGLGTLGQSLAVFGGAGGRARVRLAGVFHGVGVAAPGLGRGLCAVRAQHPDARRGRPASARWCACCAHEPIAWLLGAFYFLTFGGFVAFSIYLPTLLRAQFGLTPADAGFPRRRLRRAGDVDAAGRRLAGGSHRRRAGAVVGVRRRGRVLAAAGVAVDDAVHGRRARLCGAARTRQRRGVQARARAISRATPAPSPAWSARSADSADSSRRCCSACSATRSACSGRGSCCCR